MLMRRSSRLRALFGLLLGLSLPGSGGAWLQLAHDCPVGDAAVHAAAEPPHATHHAAPGGAAHHGHHDGHEPAGDGSHTCQCVGACDGGAIRLPAPGAPSVAFDVALRIEHRVAARRALSAPVTVPADLLPLPNAPPHA